MATRFDFDTLLACVRRMVEKDKFILDKWYGNIQPDHFFPNDPNKDEEALVKILKMILEHHRQGRWSDITLQTLDTEIKNMPDGESRDRCMTVIRKMMMDETIIKKSLDNGCLHIFMDFLKVIAIQLWSKGFSKDYQNGKISDAILKMKNFIPQLDKFSIKDYKTMDPDEIFEKLRKRSENPINNFKIGIHALDGDTGAGWYEPGTLNVFVGSTGSGKSMMNMTLLIQCLKQKRYAHVTCVEDRDQTVEPRLLSAITNIPISRLKTEAHRLSSDEMRKIEAAKGYIKEYIRIDYVYGESIEYIQNEKMYVNAQRASAGLPEYEIDIVDYTGHVAVHSFGDKMYEKYKNAYSARKDYALKHNKFVFDFVQVNREGNKKNNTGGSLLTEGDFAGAYDISHVCDTIITINRSEEQAADNRATLYVSKGREGGKGIKIEIATTFHIGKFDLSAPQQPGTI